MLRSSETILNEHIRMQMSFYRKTNPNLSQRNSFCAIDAYQQQKVNIANLLAITSIPSGPCWAAITAPLPICNKPESMAKKWTNCLKN
jgi:hypothetical protein